MKIKKKKKKKGWKEEIKEGNNIDDRFKKEDNSINEIKIDKEKGKNEDKNKNEEKILNDS